jgi:isopenicillin N synthase-like dioxygenase
VSDEPVAPIIDLEDPDVVRRLDAACRMVGFFQIRGHGIPHTVIDTMLAAATEFFRLPIEEKLRASLNDPEIERGYSAKGTEGLAYSAGVETPPDLVEAYSMGPEAYPSGDSGHRMIEGMKGAFAPNIWPERPAGMRQAMVTYYREVARLADVLGRLMAQALELDSDFFEHRTDHSIDALRVNYFSARPENPPPLPGQFGLGPHTDYGMITLLYATPVPGLQIVDQAGDWRDIIPSLGTFIVNIGDLIAQWTNDRWRSTLHRVVPMQAAGGKSIERLSIPFFREGNLDNVVECLPSCCSPENPARYAPVIAGDHLRAKSLGGRTLKPVSAASTIGDRSSALLATPPPSPPKESET